MFIVNLSYLSVSTGDARRYCLLHRDANTEQEALDEARAIIKNDPTFRDCPGHASLKATQLSFGPNGIVILSL